MGIRKVGIVLPVSIALLVLKLDQIVKTLNIRTRIPRIAIVKEVETIPIARAVLEVGIRARII